MLTLQRAGAIRREMVAARHIPYSAHVAEKVVRTVFGDAALLSIATSVLLLSLDNSSGKDYDHEHHP